MKDLGRLIGIFRGNPEVNAQAAIEMRQTRITHHVRIINQQITPTDRTKYRDTNIGDTEILKRMSEMGGGNFGNLRFMDTPLSATYENVIQTYREMPDEQVDQRLIETAREELGKEIKAARKHHK